MKKRLLKRLRMLYTLEFINIFLLPFSFLFICFMLKQDVGYISGTMMILNGILLLEGSYFWFCMHRVVSKKKKLNFIQHFKILKYFNFTLLLIALYAIMRYHFQGIADIIGTILFLSLAIAEHINYFEFQLMYDNDNDRSYLKLNKGLKKATLKKLMRK